MNNDIYSNFDCADSNACYYFFHIPKTAGTSLNAALESVFTTEEICPPYLWHDLIAYDRDKLSSFRLFRGHFYTSLCRFIDGPLRGFVFLRNPVDRALSHYGHILRATEHYLYDRAVEMGSLSRFLSDPETREMVKNYQAKSLVNNFDPIEIAAHLSGKELAEYGLEKVIETTPIELSDTELLELAKKALDKFCCIGITERFEDSIWLLGNTFGWNIRTESTALNVNKERPSASTISTDDLKLLEKMNSVDIQLYQYALSLFEKRMQEHKSKNIGNIFVSYAQNFEDIMLWRALKHVESGFYIDVGANDPSIDSVTKAFYDRGWHGINIEPISSHHLDLSKERSRDINLRCAAGAVNGEIDIWDFGVRGLATASSEVVAHQSRNDRDGILHRVPVATLTNICERYATDQIHFLKIDVEGFEKAVIEGMDFSRFRPWILVIEATKPNSTEEIYDEWESNILAANYVLAYCDGLNRFYVANEHPELVNSFHYPPNVFDGFILSNQNSELRARQTEAAADRRAAESRLRALAAESRATEAESRATEAESRATEAISSLHILLNSRSWRLTAPLRWVGKTVRWFRDGSKAWLTFAPMSRPRRVAKRILISLKKYIASRPRLKNHVLRFLAQFPSLKTRLKMVGLHSHIESMSSNSGLKKLTQTPADGGLDHLTPRARWIYDQLRAAIEQHREDSN